jgi:exodeoxyribonuclease-3
MTILSWNVNGIRAVIRKGFLNFLKTKKPDVLCLQEIKIAKAARANENFDFPGYVEFWNSAKRPGYSGTVILAREGTGTNYRPKLKWDDEGRIQALDMGKFYLVNVYFPNANHELSRLDFKIRFNNKLLSYLKKLEKSKPLIICGDFNVAHQEIDLARPKDNVGNPGFTNKERAWMTKFLASGFVDTFRHLYPNKIQYSWWSYKFTARARNIGWRIDYFCVSRKLIKNVKTAYMLDKIMGSDHCPVGIELEKM